MPTKQSQLKEALTFANLLVNSKKGKHLSDTEQVVFSGAWEGKTYQAIAEANNLSAAYLNQEVGPQLWRTLSEALGENVSKKNFKSVLESKISSGILTNHSLGIVNKEIEDNPQAAKAYSQYAEKYRSRYGLIKLLGMSHPIPLESVYTSIHLLDQLSIRRFESVVDLEKAYRSNRKRRLQIGNYRSHDGITVANECRYLMVLGNPGAGKSTFLRAIGLDALKSNSNKNQGYYVPVMLELKRFNTHEVDLISAIAEEFEHFDFPPSKEFATRLLEEGRILLLLDGLDEVPNGFVNSVMDAIDNLVTHYEKNRYVVSCRIAAYHSNLQHDFQVIQLADFDDHQIKQFIHNWFSSELDQQSKTAEKCWETLEHENNKAAKELAQTPLLLTFLCLVYDRKQNFPPIRSRLYNKALDILLEEWAAEKRVQQEVIYEGLHTDLEKVMLAEIAYQGFVNDQLFFEKQKLVEQIRNFLADTVNNPKYLDGKKILNAIAAQQGILVERAEDIYSFSHLTLQEYLAAQYISQNDDGLKELITQYLTDQRWREVFLLVAGLKDNADKLLKFMETVNQQFVNTPKLQNLLVWIEKMTNTSEEDLRYVDKRVIVFANFLALTYAYTQLDVKAKSALGRKIPVNSLALSNANSLAHALTNIETLPHAPANAFEKAYAAPKADSKAINKFIDYIQWLRKSQIYQNVDYSSLISKLINLENQLENLENQKINDIKNQRKQKLTTKKSLEDSRNFSEQTNKGKDFAKQIIQTCLEAFHLTSDMIDLSESEFKAINNYFYANLLMVECKKAAVRVSQRTWSEIESRMLMPFGEPI